MQASKHEKSVHFCLVALGSNLETTTDTSLQSLQRALRLCEGESLTICKMSRWYTSPAFPAGTGPDYVNAAIEIETHLDACDVLSALNRIENALGRTRNLRWEPRYCDLDLIAYDNAILPDENTYKYWQTLNLADQQTQTPDTLIIPHPRVQDRAFVLLPLKDVAPRWCHPVTGKTIDQMLAQLPAQDLSDISVITP